VYGPVPTGLGSAYLPGSPTLLQIDCGTMYVWPAMFCRFAYWGEAKLSVTWLPVELTLPMARPVLLTSGYFFIMLKVKATSAAVIGVPLDHFTPGRIVKVIDLPPLDHVYPVASQW